MNINQVTEYLRSLTRELKIMEVCGTHTSSIYKNGIRSLISPSIRLVSGPGCPVCVTPPSIIDGLREYSFSEDHTVLSFGDMMRVPGSDGSLASAKAEGGRVSLMYSPFDVLGQAEQNPNHTFVLAAVGFETTAPVYAALLDRLAARSIRNVKLYTALKTMPEILSRICENESVDGFICPGHVSAVIGGNAYLELCEKYKKPFVVAGFEPEQILAAIYEIVRQWENSAPLVRNLYKSVVSDEGQVEAQSFIEKYFVKTDSFWRGIGLVENSGYGLKREYAQFCANIPAVDSAEVLNPACRCTDVLLGRLLPGECPLFLKTCTPQSPVGACMVSAEGACGIYSNSEGKVK